MSKAIEVDERIVFPMVAWRVVSGEEYQVCLIEIIFARSLAEAQRGAEGGDLPGIPLGVTANQCRQLAADLMEAANDLDGKKGTT